MRAACDTLRRIQAAKMMGNNIHNQEHCRYSNLRNMQSFEHVVGTEDNIDIDLRSLDGHVRGVITHQSNLSSVGEDEVGGGLGGLAGEVVGP